MQNIFKPGVKFFYENRKWFIAAAIFFVIGSFTFDPKLADTPLSFQAQTSFWSINIFLVLIFIPGLKWAIKTIVFKDIK